MTGRFSRDDRGASEAIGTIFAIMILILFAIAVIPALSVVTNAATLAQTQQMEYEAQRLSGEIQSVDVMVRSSESTGPIGRHVSLSSHVGNQRYSLEVVYFDAMDGGYIYFRVHGRDLTVRVQYASQTRVENTTIAQSGDVYVVRKAGENHISIEYED